MHALMCFWTDEDHEQFRQLHAHFHGNLELILPHMANDITIGALRNKWRRLMEQDFIDAFQAQMQQGLQQIQQQEASSSYKACFNSHNMSRT